MTDRHDFSNVYDDTTRAAAYAALEYPNTYALAFRDLPALIAEHVRGRRALDFGCGAGRSSRWLEALGFGVVGVDIAAPMLEHARAADPAGDYRLLPDGDLSSLPAGAFDLAFAAFTFDNVPTHARKVALFRGLARTLAPGGRVVTIVSSPDIYLNEWASFSTRDYPENANARSGDTVRIVMLDVGDRRPVEDITWSDEAYDAVYRDAGLATLAKRRPLGRADEPYAWVSETTIAPWVLYVLGVAG